MKALVLCLLGVVPLFAQPDRDLGRAPVQARRLALVIGNDAYIPPANPLHNAVNDARSMKAALEDVGFNVQMSLNASQQQMETVIDEFTGSVRPGDVALFFYSGHGMQISDQNYLVPVDFQARTAVDAKYRAYPAQRVQENLEAAGAGMQILILDACRNNPFKSWRGSSDGLAAMQAGRGTYIAFATSPGKVADDNPTGRNGLFTGELIQVIGQPGLSIDQLFNRVREQVSKRSHGLQLPWSTSSVTGDFYFKSFGESTVTGPTRDKNPSQPSDLTVELTFWNSIKDEIDPSLFEDYLSRYPNGQFITIAKSKLNRLRASAEIAKPPNPTSRPTDPHVGDKKVNPKDGLTYVWIPAGTFMMGCREDVKASRTAYGLMPSSLSFATAPKSICTKAEIPQHQVTITHGFWMGQTEVTQTAYQRVTNKNPSHFIGALRPVESVPWDEAVAYCNAVGMRLPTEAEWEYAARGDTVSERYGNVDAIAWYAENSDKETHEVAHKQPNAYGLYDVLGNVWEWVADWYHEAYYRRSEKIDPSGPAKGEYRVSRGGGYKSRNSGYVRVSLRAPDEPRNRGLLIGVRCVGNLP